MLERVKTKTGQFALKWKGQWLCSSVNPQAEAAAWLSKQSMAKRSVPSAVIILGVGAGYHLVELAKNFPYVVIVAIDFEQEIIDAVKAEHSLDIANVQFVCVQNVSELQKSIAVQNAVIGPYALLEYAPGMITRPNAYHEFQMFLAARTEQGFQFIAQYKPELVKGLNLPHVREVMKDAVSIKSLESILQPQANTQAQLLVRALRELVN